MNDVGRVVREGEDKDRGSMTLVGRCSLCQWKSDRIVAPDTGTVRGNARATNTAGRLLQAHFTAEHPELNDRPSCPSE